MAVVACRPTSSQEYAVVQPCSASQFHKISTQQLKASMETITTLSNTISHSVNTQENSHFTPKTTTTPTSSESTTASTTVSVTPSPSAHPQPLQTVMPLLATSTGPTMSNAVMVPTSGSGYITRIRSPHPHDVLCGRGGGINGHSGNRRFRAWVRDRKTAYNAPNCTKIEKARIAREVVDLVRRQKPPGRFLAREDSHNGLFTTGGFWVEIDTSKAMTKTSQALREGAPSIRAHTSHTLPPTPKVPTKNEEQVALNVSHTTGSTEVIQSQSATPILSTTPSFAIPLEKTSLQAQVANTNILPPLCSGVLPSPLVPNSFSPIRAPEVSDDEQDITSNHTNKKRSNSEIYHEESSPAFDQQRKQTKADVTISGAEETSQSIEHRKSPSLPMSNQEQSQPCVPAMTISAKLNEEDTLLLSLVDCDEDNQLCGDIWASQQLTPLEAHQDTNPQTQPLYQKELSTLEFVNPFDTEEERAMIEKVVAARDSSFLSAPQMSSLFE